MRKWLIAVLALGVLASFGDLAFAQDASTPPVIAASPEAVVAADEDTSATIEWGNLIIYWLNALQAALVTVLVGGLLWAARLLPGIAGVGARFVIANYGERLIQNAVDYAVNAVEGAVKGQKLDIEVGSVVVATAVERIMELAKDDRVVAWVVNILGGKEGIADKVFRKIDLTKEASAASVLAPARVGAAPPRTYNLPKGK